MLIRLSVSPRPFPLISPFPVRLQISGELLRMCMLSWLHLDHGCSGTSGSTAKISIQRQKRTLILQGALDEVGIVGVDVKISSQIESFPQRDINKLNRDLVIGP